jgi:hypothetical protein
MSVAAIYVLCFFYLKKLCQLWKFIETAGTCAKYNPCPGGAA